MSEMVERAPLRFDPRADHSMILEPHRPFIVFNDSDDLTMEEVVASDLEAIRAESGLEFFASCAWSSYCEWFFIVADDGIALFHIDGTGFFCAKRSARFIEMFVEAPLPKNQRGRS